MKYRISESFSLQYKKKYRKKDCLKNVVKNNKIPTISKDITLGLLSFSKRKSEIKPNTSNIVSGLNSIM